MKPFDIQNMLPLFIYFFSVNSFFWKFVNKFVLTLLYFMTVKVSYDICHKMPWNLIQWHTVYRGWTGPPKKDNILFTGWFLAMSSVEIQFINQKSFLFKRITHRERQYVLNHQKRSMMESLIVLAEKMRIYKSMNMNQCLILIYLSALTPIMLSNMQKQHEPGEV